VNNINRLEAGVENYSVSCEVRTQSLYTSYISAVRMLRKDYDRKGSVTKTQISGRETQGTWSQDELVDGKKLVA
jgi:hypothetical protein